MADRLTGVTVVMPVLDEERHLAEAVRAVLEQEDPGDLELIIALGPSSDGTDDIAACLAAADDRIVLIDNPTGRTANGLNAAIARARHDVVVRVDGHSLLPKGYVRAAVATLQRTGADNVGGVMAAEGSTDYEQAVACAMRSWLGVGGAAFHIGGVEGAAPTVYLGVFRRTALERVGGYDESFTRAQDWEMNHRIRETGGLVWFTPELQVTYRPRPDARRLARQYFEYGRWRRHVARTHPETLSLRYLAAPAAVTGSVVGILVGTAGMFGGSRVALAGFALPLGYIALVLAGSALVGRDLPVRPRALLPAVVATMHWSWGIGFLTSRRSAT